MKKVLLLLAIITLAACGRNNSKNSATTIDSLNVVDTTITHEDTLTSSIIDSLK